MVLNIQNILDCVLCLVQRNILHLFCILLLFLIITTLKILLLSTTLVDVEYVCCNLIQIK